MTGESCFLPKDSMTAAKGTVMLSFLLCHG